jgi:hypothetical protein
MCTFCRDPYISVPLVLPFETDRRLLQRRVVLVQNGYHFGKSRATHGYNTCQRRPVKSLSIQCEIYGYASRNCGHGYQIKSPYVDGC